MFFRIFILLALLLGATGARAQEFSTPILDDGENLCLSIKSPTSCFPKYFGEIRIVENGKIPADLEHVLAAEGHSYADRLETLFVRNIAFVTTEVSENPYYRNVPVIYSARWVGSGQNGTLEVRADLRLKATELAPYALIPIAFRDSQSAEKLARMVHFKNIDGTAVDKETHKFLLATVGPAIIDRVLKSTELLKALTAPLPITVPKR
ncbi:MAG: hypothetical protein IT289_09620 [Oligoflexia bacterium]|nr:hypothetical protein [Oligoflexia bacterium]